MAEMADITLDTSRTWSFLFEMVGSKSNAKTEQSRRLCNMGNERPRSQG